jgi:hypothetical protein
MDDVANEFIETVQGFSMEALTGASKMDIQGRFDEFIQYK